MFEGSDISDTNSLSSDITDCHAELIKAFNQNL
jgi:hypothetical protein